MAPNDSPDARDVSPPRISRIGVGIGLLAAAGFTILLIWSYGSVVARLGTIEDVQREGDRRDEVADARAARADCVRELELAYDLALGDGLIAFILEQGPEVEVFAVERYRDASAALLPDAVDLECGKPPVITNGR